MSSASNHNFYFSIKIFHIKHNNHRSSRTSKDKREEPLDHMMEEYKKDLGEDYVPFINVIDFDNKEQQPRQ